VSERVGSVLVISQVRRVIGYNELKMHVYLELCCAIYFLALSNGGLCHSSSSGHLLDVSRAYDDLVRLRKQSECRKREVSLSEISPSLV